MVTQTTSKRSSSKAERGRGPARHAKKAKKSLLHNGVLSQEQCDALWDQDILKLVAEY